MEKLKFGNRADDASSSSWDYYGLSEREWYALSDSQRIIHFNRQVGEDIQAPLSLGTLESYDPYFNTRHMRVHRRDAGCDCQSCLQKIGIERVKV